MHSTNQAVIGTEFPDCGWTKGGLQRSATESTKKETAGEDRRTDTEYRPGNKSTGWPDEDEDRLWGELIAGQSHDRRGTTERVGTQVGEAESGSKEVPGLLGEGKPSADGHQ